MARASSQKAAIIAQIVRTDSLNRTPMELLHSIGIEVKEPLAFKSKLDSHRPVTLAATWAAESTAEGAIRSAHGKRASFVYSAAVIIVSTWTFAHLGVAAAAATKNNSKKKRTPRSREALVQGQVVEAHSCLDLTAGYMTQNCKALRELFGIEVEKRCTALARCVSRTSARTANRLDTVEKLAMEAVLELFPFFPYVLEDLEEARKLKAELDKLPQGRQHWQEYENICIRILRFLFVPPFSRILIQARTKDGHERRDAVLPNNNFSGFWRLIREEFSSRHIICELKNGQDGQQKDAINQLRVYLEKPTIGKFGLLFVRKPPSKALLAAQRAAYEQQKVMILIMHDALIDRLLAARVFTGSADSVLENEKIRFELDY